MRYALHFVPHKLEREKLALLRRQLCKRFGNRKAVMYPIHMTLAKHVTFESYKEFVDRLEAFLSRQKPVKLKIEQHLGNGSSWGGVVVEESAKLSAFQQRLVGEVAGEPFSFEPHISLVYAKNLPSLGRKTSPVKKLLLDRVSLVLQTTPHTPFRVVKHMKIGK